MLQLVVANNKGGVGKTTLAVHLASYFTRIGKPTLLVDLDAQSQATQWLTDVENENATSEQALVTGAVPELARARIPDPTILHEGRDKLFVLQATDGLAVVDTKLANEVGWHTLLKRAVLAHADKVEIVVYDCPPNLGMSVVSALYASDAVIAPVSPAFLSLSALRNLHDKVSKVNERLGGQTQMLGYVLFGADKRDGRSKQARARLRDWYGDKLFDAEVRFSSKAVSLPASKVLAWDWQQIDNKTAVADPRGHDDYRQLGDELLARLKGEYVRREEAA